jgi:hypothetical protein
MDLLFTFGDFAGTFDPSPGLRSDPFRHEKFRESGSYENGTARNNQEAVEMAVYKVPCRNCGL